jgi:hypothetical protein
MRKHVQSSADRWIDLASLPMCSLSMKTISHKYSGITFAMKCSFAGGLIMFLSMAAGEILVSPNLFGGMLEHPKIWPLIFLESAMWLFPCMLLVLPFLKALKKVHPRIATRAIVAGWIAIGFAIIIGYKKTYYPNDWSLEQIRRLDITFGWTIPCAFILVVFVFLSLQYLKQIRVDRAGWM